MPCIYLTVKSVIGYSLSGCAFPYPADSKETQTVGLNSREQIDKHHVVGFAKDGQENHALFQYACSAIRPL
jgi:hypothetical protein